MGVINFIAAIAWVMYKKFMQSNSFDNTPSYLYIFLDEGGNFDFSSKGSKYFTLTSITMVRPFELAQPLDDLKYDLIERGEDIFNDTRDGEYFHASEDLQEVRNRVFSLIQKKLSKIQIDSLIVEKRKTMPHLREPHYFYPEMFNYLFKYPLARLILKQYRIENFKKIIFITDSIPVAKKKKIIEKSIKIYAKNILANKPYQIFHHSSKSSMELQIVDYCNWAIFKKWERKDTRSYDLISGGISTEFDIFNVGQKYYY